MKKLFTILVSVLVLAAMMMPSVSAEDMTAPVGDVYVPFADKTPTIDGTVNAEEWGAPLFTMNDTNCKAVWQAGFAIVPEENSVDVYALWTEECFYFAYDVTDPTLCKWTEYTFDGGDAIQALFDFGRCLDGLALTDADITGGNRAPMIAAGPMILQDGSETNLPLWLHQCTAYDSIMDVATFPAACKVTEKGWMLEGCIPWELFITDSQNKGGEDLPDVKAGTEMSALFIYNDYDKHTMVNWYGTTKTGYETEFNWEPEQHGVNFILLGAGETAPETSKAPETTAEETTKDETTAAQTTEGAAQTTAEATTAEVTTAVETEADKDEKSGINPLFIVIPAAVVVIAAAVVAIILAKKKKV